jgi:hypothetical protein
LPPWSSWPRRQAFALGLSKRPPAPFALSLSKRALEPFALSLSKRAPAPFALSLSKRARAPFALSLSKRAPAPFALSLSKRTLAPFALSLSKRAWSSGLRQACPELGEGLSPNGSMERLERPRCAAYGPAHLRTGVAVATMRSRARAALRLHAKIAGLHTLRHPPWTPNRSTPSARCSPT